MEVWFWQRPQETGIKMATKKEQTEAKNMVERILKLRHEKYDDWLYQTHLKVISDNQVLILQALDRAAEKGGNPGYEQN